MAIDRLFVAGHSDVMLRSKTTINSTLLSLLGLLILSTAQADRSSSGDTLTVRAYNEQNPSLPTNGLTKQAVATRYGEPQQKVAAVGEPPISSWQYPEYVVYFEHSRVIISVPKQR